MLKQYSGYVHGPPPSHITSFHLSPFPSLSPTRLNLERHVQQYEYWADKFQQLPMYFMGFYGAVDIKTVIEVSKVLVEGIPSVPLSIP